MGRSRSVSLAVGDEAEEEVARQMDLTSLDKTLTHYRDRVRYAREGGDGEITSGEPTLHPSIRNTSRKYSHAVVCPY